MVAYTSTGYDAQIRLIRKVLRNAAVPQRWYSFFEEENKVCIIPESDGIHIYIPDRGIRKGERVTSNFNTAIGWIADNFEYEYTKKVQHEAYKVLVGKNLKKGSASRRMNPLQKGVFAYKTLPQKKTKENDVNMKEDAYQPDKTSGNRQKNKRSQKN